MLTWNQIERNLRAAGCSEQNIARHREAHVKRCRVAAIHARQKQREEEYERYRRANLLDYFEELADHQAAHFGV
jgi:hypothetical protein